MIKEHPILFTTEMVKAILNDRKTQTRRTRGLDLVNKKPNNWIYSGLNCNNDHLFVDVAGIETGHDPQECTHIIKYPYGKVGDRLWVRENIQANCYPYQDGQFNYGAFLIKYIADGELIKCPTEHEKWWRHNWHKQSTTTIPSIFMPKWAARIWLEITDIRVERVQNITLEDCEKEGTLQDGKLALNGLKINFIHFWDSINAKRGFGWDKNPWVWVIEFKRI